MIAVYARDPPPLDTLFSPRFFKPGAHRVAPMFRVVRSCRAANFGRDVTRRRCGDGETLPVGGGATPMMGLLWIGMAAPTPPV